MSLTRKVAYNTVIQIIGKGVTTIISLFLVAALTRYLGVAGYGQYTTIFAYLAFFGVLADFGFFWILVREIANPKSDINKVTSNILTLRTAIGVVVYAGAYLASFLIPQYADLRGGIGIAAFSMLFLALNSTFVGVFQNKLRMDLATLTDVIGRLIILGFTLYLIKIGSSLNLILWAYAIGNIVNLLLSAWLGRSYVQIRPAFDLKYWKEIFYQTLPMAIVLILGLVYFRIDTLMLSLMKSSVDVGIYGPPYKVLEMLILLPSMFMGNVFPIVSRYIHAADNRLQGALQKSFEFLLIMAVPVTILVIVAAEPIIRIVAGQEFVVSQTVQAVFGLPATSVLALQILMVAVGFSFISHIFSYLVIALGKQSKLIWPNIILVILNIGLNLIVIPKYSYIGAAAVTVITEILVLVFTWRVAHNNLQLRFDLKIVWKVFLSGLVMVLLSVCVGHYLNWILVVALSMLAYLIILWSLGGINKDMLIRLVKKGDS